MRQLRILQMGIKVVTFLNTIFEVSEKVGRDGCEQYVTLP